MPQWKQFSGQWTVTQAAQAKGAGTWPSLPGAPTIGTATAGVGEVSVAFTAPANPGYPTTLTYEVTSSPGGFTATGSSSPITVTGLTNGTEYTFTVTATNDTGTGPASAASNGATPIAAGYLYGIGKNDQGQLGQGDRFDYSSPVQVGSDSTWMEVTGGAYVTLGVKTNGTLWGMGEGQYGQNGSPSRADLLTFTQIGSLTSWVKGTNGNQCSGAIRSNGTLYAWGFGSKGTLGNNNTINRSSPVQVGASSDWADFDMAQGGAMMIAVKTNGTLWSWGSSNFGQMGINISGVSAYRSSPIQVGGLTNWAQVQAGGDFWIALKTDGTLWSCGGNFQGALGLGLNPSVHRSSPVQIGSDTDWYKLNAKNEAWFAIKTDGTLWGCGSASGGAMGQNNENSQSSPVQIGALTNWAEVGHAKAVKTDGTLWAWGKNDDDGNVGQNNIINYSSPVQVGSQTTWLKVEGYWNTTLAINSVGT